MALLDTAAPPSRVDPPIQSAAPERPLEPFARSELRRRGVPFVATLALALALLPIQQFEARGSWLAAAVALLAAVAASAFGLSRARVVPPIAGSLLMVAFLVAVTLLRDATGGPLSGYGALLYLAPFWAALYDTRAQVMFATVAMFLAQAWSWDGAGFGAAVDVPRAVLTTVVVGMMSLAVHGKVQALRRARVRIEQEAEARSAAIAKLAATNEALEASNRELEQFAYVSSHDIQEPLRMIRSFSQLFVQRHGARLDDEGRELLGYVVDGAQRAQSLVNDLLQYSLVGTTDRPFSEVALDDVLDRAIETLAPTIIEAEARVVRPGDLPTVRGDAAQLENLLVNLVGNALKYRHPDRPPVVHVAAEPLRHGGWAITIRDNGIGFAPEHAEKIFLMFQRLHGRTRYEGTGIGLAICTRIAQRHGGTIRAEAIPGEGATFRVTIGATA